MKMVYLFERYMTNKVLSRTKINRPANWVSTWQQLLTQVLVHASLLEYELSFHGNGDLAENVWV